MILALAVLAGAAACTPDQPATPEAPSAAEYPEWIERVYPPPGSEASVEEGVQVLHGVVTPNRAVRLVIDGVDVTTYATQHSPGLLEYDVEEIAPEPPVELDPGSHEAMVELLEVDPATEEGGVDYEVLETIDMFAWTFTIL